MLSFLAYFIIILGLGNILFILLRKIPLLARLSKEERIILSNKKGFWSQLREINLKAHWLNFILYLERFLQATRRQFLRIEKILARWIVYLRQTAQAMTRRSKEWKEWIRQNRKKQLKLDPEPKSPKEEKTYFEKILSTTQDGQKTETEEIGIRKTDEISFSDLKKPTKEEQKWINQIIENPKNITAYKMLGLFYWKQHNYKDARASLEMALKLGSRDRKIKQILEELKEMF